MKNVWSKADLHVHTTHSDGHASVEEVLEHAARHTDLGVIAITDHDTIDGALETLSLAEEYGIEVVVGEEVSTVDGELLALFIEQRLPPGRPAAETIAVAHEQGGLAVAAHPYHRLAPSLGRRGLPSRASGPVPEWSLDAIEAFNAGLLLPGGNRRAAGTAAVLGLPVLGGSDSHHPRTIGYGHTLFPGHSAADLRAAIEFGRTVAAGRYWGLLRTAEIISLFVRRELATRRSAWAGGHNAECRLFPVPVQELQPGSCSRVATGQSVGTANARALRHLVRDGSTYEIAPEADRGGESPVEAPVPVLADANGNGAFDGRAVDSEACPTSPSTKRTSSCCKSAA